MGLPETPPPDVTIVIRAKNEAELLPRCLEMIFRQESPFAVEVLLIDSGSTDRTLEIARRFEQVRVREIKPEAFNYGQTLNDGIGWARGRYVVALSAHCVPVDRHWLQNLVEPLERDATIAGAFSRQVPWPECDPVERNFLEKHFKENGYVLSDADAGEDPFRVLFSNASACYRRALARTNPFPALPWAEDRVWAHGILRAGHRVAYASHSVVYHSHRRSVKGYYRLGFAEGQAKALVQCPPTLLRSRDWFGVRPLWWMFRTWQRVCTGQGAAGGQRTRLALGALARQVAYDVGHWRGERSVRRRAGRRD